MLTGFGQGFGFRLELTRPDPKKFLELGEDLHLRHPGLFFHWYTSMEMG